MKIIVFIIILALSLTLQASDNCHDLMRSFLNRNKSENLYAQCLSPDKNELKDLAASRFFKINMGMSAATNIIGYTQRNWEEQKNFEWFARLGYGVALSAVAGTLAQKIISNNGNRFNYLLKDYIFTRVVTVGYFGGLNLFFDNTKSQRAKLEKLKTDPNFKEDIKKLKNYAEDQSRLDRAKKEIISYLSHLEVINIGIGIHEGIDFDHLKPSDLDDQDIQDVVIASIIAQEYKQQKGALVVTGSKQNDFLLYDSIYSVLKIPKEILVNKIIAQTLCLNSNNPTRGYTQAIGITAINQILFADYYGISYQVLRTKLIDQ